MDRRLAVVKIVVVGNANAGKTSLIKRYCFDTFSKNYKATIGSDFAMKTINLNDNTVLKLQFWDIAGQERFGTMTSHYYRDALGAMIVFDLTDASSFEAVEKWRDDMDRKMKPDPDIPILLVGNKVDLVQHDRAKMIVTEEAMDSICTRFENFIGWQLTSAAEDENIKEAIQILLDKIMERTNLDDDDKVIFPEQTSQETGCCT
eukprot:TRINITY_DN2060_c0_g1_i1.p1 TRINITY_DN2060_c0_g1~~TRINITY_DN2060_c0_g1_i1.p1  ORF type:complete len:204 (-),score=36.36 TRINITY_DN2060_c0_g1_i1:47-658(-)